MDRPPFLPSPQWHHLRCVDVASTGVTAAANIIGFDALSADNKKAMREKFSTGDADSDDEVSLLALPQKQADKKKAKIKAEAASEPTAKMSSAAEKAMKAHSDKLFNIRTKLKSVYTPIIKDVLAFNDVNSAGGEVTLQARCADIMLHGVPSMCPQCKMGRLAYDDGKYKCKANVDEYSRCQYKSSEAQRETFKMPKDIGDEYLQNFKFVKTAIPKALLKQVEAVDVVMKEKEGKRKETMERMEEEAAAKRAKEKAFEEASDPSTCLKGLVFALHSTKHKPLDKDTLSAKIASAGGKLGVCGPGAARSFVMSTRKRAMHMRTNESR